MNHLLDPALYRKFADNVWFQADLSRTLSNMVSTESDHYRTKVHPIFSIVSHSLVAPLRAVWPGSDDHAAMRIVLLVAATWTGGLYALGRLLDASRLEAAVFTLLGISSAAFLYWFSVPETYGWGSLSILVVLLVAAFVQRAPVSNKALVAASAFSLSMTVTNWMAGLALAFAARPRKIALRISALGFATVAGVSIVQKMFFRTSQLFFLGSREEAMYVSGRDGGGPLRKLCVILFHSVTMPAQASIPGGPHAWPLLSVQHSAMGSGSRAGLCAFVLWAMLFGGGLYGLVAAYRMGIHRTFVLVVVGTLVGQAALHAVYGEETFLYTLHQLPLLIGIALFALRFRARSAVVALAFVVAMLNFGNNLKMFSEAEAHVLGNVPQRDQVMRAMHERPREVWPRSSGHVVLGSPGDRAENKAYEEPGGSFSPAQGSFGISVWITDPSGALVTTSDTIAMRDVRQHFGEFSESVPALIVETPYYGLTWSRDHDAWRLELRCKDPASHRCWTVFRSVGPSGGPLVTAAWRGTELRLNDAWRVALAGSPAASFVANESAGIRLGGSRAAEMTDPSGWLYAAAEAPLDGALDLRIVPTKPVSNPSRLHVDVDRLLRPDIPNQDFAASVLAQQAHLLMGLTDNQTRPGEPTNYAFEWLRDATYVVVALARAGQTTAASELMRRLAKEDFYGGFGAEADAPGLALWALGQVTETLGDAALDAELWPHVARKAAIIEDCLTTASGVRAKPTGTFWGGESSEHVCEAARFGLIAGRMDNHFPMLFVNATAYAGLQSAIRWAERTGHPGEAARWSATASSLARAWARLYLESPEERKKDAWRSLEPALPDLKREKMHAVRWMHQVFDGINDAVTDDRTRIVGLWPSFVVATDDKLRTAYGAQMTRRWQALTDAGGQLRERPVWTYFSLAEAHQWLLLGEPERAHSVLSWFHTHSAAPGLYTWWEGTAEENGSFIWDGIRGFVSPDGVSPHYWTAAEMLLLQLDMLANVDEGSAERPLVIGAGVQRSWLDSDMSSGTLHTSRGPVSWKFLHEGVLEITTTSDSTPVRIAPVFSNARVVRQISPG